LPGMSSRLYQLSYSTLPQPLWPGAGRMGICCCLLDPQTNSYQAEVC